MAQTSTWAVPNAPSGLSMRGTVNTILDVLRTCSSGPAAPSPTVGGQFWLDTGVSPAVLRMRNVANTAWLVVNPETIPALSVRGNSGGSAAAESSVDMATLRGMLGFPTNSTGLGEWRRVSVASSGVFTLPAGGTWAYFYIRHSNAGAISAINGGVAAGGTNVLTLGAGEALNSLVWRVN